MRLLEADPDLGRQLDAEHADAVKRMLQVPVAALPAGRWEPRLRGEVRGALGLLVLEGVISRTASIGEASCMELIGTGDLIRPWQAEGEGGIVPCGVTWEVLEPARLAVLDRAVAAEMARWPELSAELFARVVRRSRWQGLSAAIGHLKRVDQRLLVLLWHLAERWGRVTPEGVMIPLSLTHERLAALVGAQRPSVTTALTGLVERGFVARRPDRRWVLPPAGQRELDRICGEEELARRRSLETLHAA